MNLNPNVPGPGQQPAGQTNADGTLAPIESGETGLGAPAEAIAGLNASAVKKGPPMTAILCGLVVVVAGGTLFAMRQIGLGPAPAKAAGKDSKFEVPTPRLNAALQQAILADLNTSRATLQVPGEFLRVNPFRQALAVPPKAVAAGEPSDDGAAAKTAAERKAAAEARKREAEAFKAKVATSFNNLQLTSTSGSGASATARINDRLYRVGDTVGEFFTITSISHLTVELSHLDTKYTLTTDRRPR